MKIAILAKGQTLSKFPGREKFDQTWGLNQQARDRDDLDLCFVMDDVMLRLPFYDGPEFPEWLKTYKGRWFTSRKYDDWPTSTEFPIVECAKFFGLPLGISFYSTPDYMIACAIMQGATEIHMYGCDVLEIKANEMRSSTALWIGAAESRGITVTVPQGSFYYIYTRVPMVIENGLYGYVYRPRIEDLVGSRPEDL